LTRLQGKRFPAPNLIQESLMPFDLLIFAAIALFLIFRLGSVLGKRTGHQKPPEFPMPEESAKPTTKDRSGERDDNIVRMPSAFEEPEEESAHFSGPAGEGLRRIADADQCGMVTSAWLQLIRACGCPLS